jgi:acyl-CoA hydrolase
MTFETQEKVETTLVTDALYTYVAMDEHGQKRTLPTKGA